MPERETGMLDVGKHCQYCRQIDFLPFHCTLCNSDFCSVHRTQEAHHCKALLAPGAATPASRSRSSSQAKGEREVYFKALLPDKAAVRVKQETSEKPAQGTSIKDRLVQRNSTNALDKLKRFFAKYSSKRKNMNLSASNKVIQVAKIKRTAKGDDKIPHPNRVYIWCYYIDESNPKEHDIFINRQWPLGRVLDYLSHHMDVKNVNLSAHAGSGEKLYLYKRVKENEWKMLDPSGRVNGNIEEGDALYLIRGNDMCLLK
ncbi:AFR041Cp [Eremothecium gossypii ATCC 10895]|uniref:AFR041Cp n=1 Tax=Eremothecium gossypii (strain ATCC 10895 / CBS 109.51 / FGSC 9923 / NRRL Y-1056) TaxID=284811 RepID=Q754N1_EREGS|nr:AFR041Cp [Eremothecium gossypii ATCC 10895]AAS53412.1 AFR041Cp [Eremothecium gossypii ATCC 10895]AEY97723.1 FAFR041Cp [Eremothecium gossypii FDAG1]